MTAIPVQSRAVRPAPAIPGERGAMPTVPPWLLIGGAVLGALLIGRFMADGHIKYATALILLVCYGPLVLFDLAAGLAVYIAVLFFQDLSILSSGPNAIGVIAGLGWIGALLGGRYRVPALREQRWPLLLMFALVVWVTLTTAWSVRPGPAGTESFYWWLCALGFVVVLTAVSTGRDVRLIAFAFVAGSVISVLIGLATGGLNTSANTVTQTAVQGRFVGGGGDPNTEAAVLVATMFLMIGLFAVVQGRVRRLALLAAFGLVALGFFLTQSRGGLLALAAATAAALVLAPRQRRRILGMTLVFAALAIVTLAVAPAALHRIVDVGGGSSGRGDLWKVAWRVFTSHPLFGVGIGNFTVVEAHYVLQPGVINRIAYIVDVPYLAHNTYLQLLAEAGIVGLTAFAAVAFTCLRAGWLAVRRFEEKGIPGYADLTRSVMMGTIGMLTALFFISDGDDLRLWFLLALGPVLLTLANRAPPEPETRPLR